MKEFFPKANEEEDGCDFEYTFLDYLRRQGLKDAAKDLRSFDFSTTNDILITSVPGYHKGESMHLYGHMKVRKYLSALPASSAPLIAQVSFCHQRHSY